MNKEQQYRELYGPYEPGAYAVGDEVRFRLPGRLSEQTGAIIWSCFRDNQFVYIIDAEGWPDEVRPASITGRA